MKNNKGQSALEFLMTYGWAFLAMLLVVGVLVSSGFLNPENFIPEKCRFGQEAICPKGKFLIQTDADETIKFALINHLGADIQIEDGFTESKSSFLDGCTLERIDWILGYKTTFVWKQGKEAVFSFACGEANKGLKPGRKEEVVIKLLWHSTEQVNQHTMIGKVYTAVQEI